MVVRRYLNSIICVVVVVAVVVVVVGVGVISSIQWYPLPHPPST